MLGRIRELQVGFHLTFRMIQDLWVDLRLLPGWIQDLEGDLRSIRNLRAYNSQHTIPDPFMVVTQVVEEINMLPVLLIP